MNGEVVWVSSVYVEGGNVPVNAGGAYAIVVAAGSSIEMALQAVRALCERERYVGVEVTSCRKVDPDDPEDDLDESLRERALRVKSSGDPVVATLHTFPPGH